MGDFVLKICNSEEDPRLLEAQIEALALLEREPGRLETARVVPNRAGERWTREGSHPVWLVTWLEGTVLADLTDPPGELWTELGRGLGDLDLRLASFDVPAARRNYAWDLRHAPEALRFNEHVRDPDGREVVRRRLEEYREETAPRFRSLPSQVIHNDANDYNLLARREGAAARVVALLDFGDLLWTARACEVAIAATYAMFDAPAPAASGARVLAGYHEILGLDRAEVRVVPRLIEARLCVSVTMSAYRRAQEPENEYLSVSEKPAWAVLGRMVDTPISRWIEAFEEACAAVRPFGEEDVR